MKWLLTLCLILSPFGILLQRIQAESPSPSDFGPLASLIGEWQGTDAEGKPMTVSYYWTGGGTSLVETMAMAEKPAMMTMYYADKGTLMLTHYCKLGNQPRMRAAMPEGDPKMLAFSFVDAANLAKSTDAHMHTMSFTFRDQNHFAQEWVLSKDGMELPHRFEFSRVQ